MKNIFFFQTIIGRIGIAEQDNKISNVFFETDEIPGGVFMKEKNDTRFTESVVSDGMPQCKFYINQTNLLKDAGKQLEEYLKGNRTVFDLPLAPSGTDFMKNVWKCLCSIPYGQTRSYREIAEAAGNAKACRAVGMANNRNPIPVFIPCHRVIGTNGSLTGYRGGMELKQKLLELENIR